MSENEFELYLTEIYGMVIICGMEFASGYALRELDPIAFDVAHADHDSED